MGLVYYAIAWTILAYFFFDSKEVIAIGILAMSYGDGFASLIGTKYGVRKFRIFKDEKSYIGTLTMFIFTFFLIILALTYYQFFNQNIYLSVDILPWLLLISAISAIIEGLTPFGLDNLSVPLFTAVLYWIII
jgi:dolichol kinase